MFAAHLLHVLARPIKLMRFIRLMFRAYMTWGCYYDDERGVDDFLNRAYYSTPFGREFHGLAAELFPWDVKPIN
jgi:hypothetical protein